MSLPLATSNPCCRCGACCKDFKGTGLPVFPEEFRRYQALADAKKLLFSFSAKRAARTLDGRAIISHYLIHTQPCVHFLSETGCSIYESRPLACKAFPYYIRDEELLVSLACHTHDAFTVFSEHPQSTDMLSAAKKPLLLTAQRKEQLHALHIRGLVFFDDVDLCAHEVDIDMFLAEQLMLSLPFARPQDLAH